MLLTVEQLSFRYPRSSNDALHELSFSIAEGEIFGFLGPSGAGKSTTQKILYKLLQGYRGEVTFAGKTLGNWGRDFYEQIGVSFELPNHYLKLTAEENLRFFAAFYRKKSAEPLEFLRKVGLEEDARKPVAAFSKGMKMRLNFARCLLHDPEMYFLDEPTTGLDPINAGRIKELIRELQQRGKTIFLTTHNMFDADQLCDRVALIHQGALCALDSPARLKLAHGQKRVLLTLEDSKGSDHSFPLEGLGTNEEFLELIRRRPLRTIHSQEATLEEVFIKLTGSQLV